MLLYPELKMVTGLVTGLGHVKPKQYDSNIAPKNPRIDVFTPQTLAQVPPTFFPDPRLPTGRRCRRLYQKLAATLIWSN